MYSVHMLYLFLNHNIMVLFVGSRASDGCAPPVPCSVAPAYNMIYTRVCVRTRTSRGARVSRGPGSIAITCSVIARSPLTQYYIIILYDTQ